MGSSEGCGPLGPWDAGAHRENPEEAEWQRLCTGAAVVSGGASAGEGEDPAPLGVAESPSFFLDIVWGSWAARRRTWLWGPAGLWWGPEGPRDLASGMGSCRV